MLSNRDASYDCLELFQRCESLAHMEPRVHLRHVGEGGARSEGKDDRATETPVADLQGIDAIRVQSTTRTCVAAQCSDALVKSCARRSFSRAFLSSE